MSKFWCGSSSSSSSDDDSTVSSLENEQIRETQDLSKREAIDQDIALDPDLAWSRVEADQVFVEPQTAVTQTLPRSSFTRIVCMSDTHGKHRQVSVPPGDVLIHGGDFTKSGEPGTVQDVSRFFDELDFECIVCIAGNHELTFQPTHYGSVWHRFHPSPFDPESCRRALQNCTYLQDEACTLFGDIQAYGSPWQPEFYDWAFNLDRGEPLRQVWAQIPSSTDVLITHGPPLGRGDACSHGGRAGCYDLLNEVQNRIKPRVHVFGHIHEGFGVSSDGTTLFVNASNLTFNYKATNPCIVVDVPHDRSKQAIVVRPECKIQTRTEFVLWLKDLGFDCLARHVENATDDSIPTGNALFHDQAYNDMCDKMFLQRDLNASKELRRALSLLYAESFVYTPRNSVEDG